ncbi:putative phage tail assembly chaperone [Victivallis sp. Marseille-Q1083]|uniref:putative phage tail assembly chaperone n=1 Tax=Victivallis sp. Marseille-Q1083 TaxID=2717288 RepID=UPI00158A7F4E|nr:putative phage tail assembly chaperone [Victivallis sp. Marseille-Q1083]
MKEKSIVLIIGKIDFAFNVSLALYNEFVDAIQATSKTVPATNFVRRALADKAQLAALNELIGQGLAVDIAGKLIEEFRPKVEIELKKSDGASSN